MYRHGVVSDEEEERRGDEWEGKVSLGPQLAGRFTLPFLAA